MFLKPAQPMRRQPHHLVDYWGELVSKLCTFHIGRLLRKILVHFRRRVGSLNLNFRLLTCVYFMPPNPLFHPSAPENSPLPQHKHLRKRAQFHSFLLCMRVSCATPDSPHTHFKPSTTAQLHPRNRTIAPFEPPHHRSPPQPSPNSCQQPLYSHTHSHQSQPPHCLRTALFLRKAPSTCGNPQQNPQYSSTLEKRILTLAYPSYRIVRKVFRREYGTSNT